MAMVSDIYDGSNTKSSYEAPENAGYSDVDFDRYSYTSRFNSSENNDSADELRNMVIRADQELYKSYVEKWLATLDKK